jgi:hypothetical protein
VAAIPYVPAKPGIPAASTRLMIRLTAVLADDGGSAGADNAERAADAPGAGMISIGIRPTARAPAAAATARLSVGRCNLAARARHRFGHPQTEKDRSRQERRDSLDLESTLAPGWIYVANSAANHSRYSISRSSTLDSSHSVSSAGEASTFA